VSRSNASPTAASAFSPAAITKLTDAGFLKQPQGGSELQHCLERARLHQCDELMNRDTRNAFQNAMQQKFINEVEHLSGRGVTAFISDSHIGPDIETELFMLTTPI